MPCRHALWWARRRYGRASAAVRGSTGRRLSRTPLARLAAIAGQCPLDLHGRVIGPGDLPAQVDQVVANATKALAAAGAEPEDVIRSVICVLSDDPKVLASVWDQLVASEIGPAFSTASTLLGVAALGYREQLVEVDLTAAVT